MNTPVSLTDDELQQVVGALFGSSMRLDLAASGRKCIHQAADKRRRLARRLLDARMIHGSDSAAIFHEDVTCER